MGMELRFNPLIGEWIMISTVRQARPWQPNEGCPFDPGNDETGIGWSYLILPNKYPMLVPNPPAPIKVPGLRSRRSFGYCKVVVESPNHSLSDLHDLKLDELTNVMLGIRQEIVNMEKQSFVKYVFFFRNKGREIGVSLTHPHSQIYALPYVPLRIRLEAKNMKNYMKRRGTCMLCDILRIENSSERLLYVNDGFSIIKPYYSMWPYEIHIIPRRHVQRLSQLTDDEVRFLADSLRASTYMLDSVLGRDMPYVMAVHQAPVKSHKSFHLHVEFYPMLRDASKMKYAAGVEWGLWTFTYDSSPEAKAAELRKSCANARDLIGRCI
ncbi:MAG: galactose-1-phosphate uridylyltransferase [Thermocladium sp.]